MNTLVLRLDCLQDFLKHSQDLRNTLLDELIDNATDPVIRRRRFRMLHDLASYEADVIGKILTFDGDRSEWESSLQSLRTGLTFITNRSA